MILTRDDLLKITHVRAIGLERFKKIVGVSTDSRTVKTGDLFVALVGEKFDGHEFVGQVLTAGVNGLIVEQAWYELKGRFIDGSGVPTLVVTDSTRAFGELARVYRRKFKIPVLAVGGSNGKTTTKEMIANVLRTKFPILGTEGNLNNHVGVPQTLLRLEKKHKAAIVEIGTNHFGEIAYLCGILEPTHGLITNMGREHLEFFGNENGVAKAEGELFSWLLQHGGKKAVGLVNADDRRVVKQSGRLKKKISYGFHADNVSVRGKLARLNQHGCAEVEVKAKGKKPFVVKLNIPGKQNAMNALAASAVGLSFNVPSAKIQKALASFSAVVNRMQVLHIAGVMVINDTYNANPDSAIAALETLGSIQTSGKRIAVLADMLELGTSKEEDHRAVGTAVGTNHVEYLLTYGTLARHIHDAASVKFKAHYDQKNMLAEYLNRLLSNGDVVLVKGSRSMKMEDVITFLQERSHYAA
jgi:UDP-N-acetylmuramoyl-tripeptide--D-alanyl-D-alanine ligase